MAKVLTKPPEFPQPPSDVLKRWLANRTDADLDALNAQGTDVASRSRLMAPLAGAAMGADGQGEEDPERWDGQS